MTNQEILNVARVVAEYLDDNFLTPEDEQAILDMYYSRYGQYEEQWREVAERIR